MSAGCSRSSSHPTLPRTPSSTSSIFPNGGNDATESPRTATRRPENKGCGTQDSSLRCTTKPLEQNKGAFAGRRVLVKGKRMVMLDEAAYEALMRKADLWEP